MNAHFRRASLALSEAYAQCPPAFQRHRTQILSFLIPANLLIGRLPSAALLSRPEAATGLAEIFAPLAEAVRTGSFVTLQTGLARHESWLWQRGLLLTLTYRLRPLVWRSLARKTFLLTYVPPPPGPEAAGSRRAATLSLADLLTVAKFVQRQLEAAVTQEGGDVEQQEQSQQIQQQQSALAAAAPPRVPSKHAKSAGVSSVFLKAVSNATTAATRTAAAPSSTKGQARRQRRLLRPNEGLLWGSETPSLQTVEAIVASLVQQGLMHGFIAHGQARFAVTGTRGNRARGSAVRAGWPDPATVLGTVGWRDEPHAAGGGLDQQPDAAVGEPFEVGVPGWVEDRR